MIEVLCLIAGLALGGTVAWLLAASRARGAAAIEAADLRTRLAVAESTLTDTRTQLAASQSSESTLRNEVAAVRESGVALQSRLDEAARNVEQQKALLAEAEKKFREVFVALSTDSLKSNSETFLKQADERVRPLRESLERYEKQIKDMEAARQSAYGGLREQVSKLTTSSDALHRQTISLASALRSPTTRGRWGEQMLQRVVEAAGMTPRVDFDTQADASTEAGRKRPDMIVHLPHGRDIIVDAKAPLAAYLDAMEIEDPAARAAKLTDHAAAVRGRIVELSRKDYAADLANTPEFVVMFLPGESFFSAALQHDPDLFTFAAERRVVLASPTTLLALLWAAAHGWQQQQMAVNAERIADAGRELFNRVFTFTEHLVRIGDSLGRTTDAYNKAVGSWESRVAPAGRALHELGATADELPSVDLLTTPLRALPPADEAPSARGVA